MNISFKDYSHISEFIERNRGKISEAQMALLVKARLDAEFASELVADAMLIRAKPKSIIGERLLELHASKEAALEAAREFRSLSFAEKCQIVPQYAEIADALGIGHSNDSRDDFRP